MERLRNTVVDASLQVGEPRIEANGYHIHNMYMYMYMCVIHTYMYM